ncbi:MAG: hypothetical protein CMM56_04165 [Rhodospirillaceae bacterium]|nr:hypothetical protein [Rhodospirillaceae bacterium]|tara:strand:+ start:2852 stop:4069 length:1218 start_codon:yes stop_codon:yes gene_type:complete
MAKHFVIVGAGQAAAQAIQTLRQNKFDGKITLVGDEKYPPYQRPPLSKKFLAGELQRERLLIRPIEFYKANNIDLELGVRATEVDPIKSKVRLDNDRILEFDGLLLATGSRVRQLEIPGSNLGGVHYVRTLNDVDAILPKFKTAKQLVIIGAGYIGLEVAAVAIANKLEVTILEATKRPMSRTVSSEVSSFYHEYHTRAGVNLNFSTMVNQFKGNTHVDAVITANGKSFSCDLVIVGVGIKPEVELAQAASLLCEDGIVVNEYACTESSRIFAAGDCTNHPNKLLNKRIRLESVQNAIDQAKTAAKTYLGIKQPYSAVPWFWSDQYKLKLQIAGLPEEHDVIFIHGNPKQSSFAVFYTRLGRITAVEAVNLPKAFMIGKQLIASRSRVDVEKLSDMDFDLKAFIS